jgi:hypothetical protein
MKIVFIHAVARAHAVLTGRSADRGLGLSAMDAANWAFWRTVRLVRHLEPSTISGREARTSAIQI